mmetsp:Transcript_26906/g.30790  ORF Transcript_26906/g.30790 Transcript_26906/m.30790 type:complete len:265 (+) Transcript_26906:54-848(+)
MLKIATILTALFTTAAAAPAIVWSAESIKPIHSSEAVDINSVVGKFANPAGAESSLASVVFVLGRDENGSEGLTTLTTSGSLPNVASKYSEASLIQHFVRGLETVDTISKDLGGATKLSLEEFQSKETTSKDIVLVRISSENKPEDIDSAVSSAIDNADIGLVVLTSVRGITEVVFEKDLRAKKNYFESQQASRRRLEDANADDANGDDEDKEYYFVNFTPNIFSGLLFFFFFVAVTFTGLSSLGAITGQDVYVSKYPTIGREA